MFRAASLIFLFIAANANARVYTEAEIVKLYMDSSPKLQALRDTYLSQAEKLSQAKSSLFPTIELDGGVNNSRTSGTASPFGSFTQTLYTGAVNLNQPLYTGGKLKSGLDLAKLNVYKAEQDYLAAKQQALQDLLAAAYTMGHASEQKLVLQDSDRFEDSYTSITRGKLARGSARSYELSQAEAQLASYLPRLRQAERDLVNARTQLVVQMGAPELNSEKDPLEFSLPDPKPYNIPRLADLLKTADENRPEIKSLEFAKQQAQAQKTFDLADDMPNLAFAASEGYQSPDREEFFDGRSLTYSFGLNLKIPLFSGLSSIFKRRADEYVISSAEKNLAEERRQIEIEVQQQYESVKAAKDVFETTTAWSRKARQALEQSLQSYRVGTISSVQVNQIQTGREQAALAYIDALQDYHLSLLRMRKALGIDLEKIYSQGGK